MYPPPLLHMGVGDVNIYETLPFETVLNPAFLFNYLIIRSVFRHLTMGTCDGQWDSLSLVEILDRTKL